MKIKKLVFSMFMALVFTATALPSFSVFAQEAGVPTNQVVSGDSVGQRAQIIIFDNVSIDRSGRMWEQPQGYPYARADITNSTNETMTVSFMQNGNLVNTHTINANDTGIIYGTNFSGYMSIDFMTPSGPVSGKLTLVASTNSLKPMTH